MPSQHITGEEANQTQGIMVPWELEGLCILRQEVQADGKLRVEVIATKKGEQCPHCATMCVKQHDVRPRRKRDVPLRGHVVELVLHKRRFWCLGCRKAFTESDRACGRRRRTTVRLREEIGKQASTRPIAHVASHYQVGPRFVHVCLEVVASLHLAQRGLSLEEGAQLPTPRYLGIDEFARRKGHRYDTILCDLDGRHALEVSAGRKQEDVTCVLERLTDCDAVAAVSMDMSRPFREAVQLCLPRACIVADHFHVIQQSRANLAQAFPEIAVAWILAFFDFLPTRLSNGFVEGKNNRTKAIMRQAYGYRNRRHLRLRILLEEIA